MNAFLLVWLVTQGIGVLLVWLFVAGLGRRESLVAANAPRVVVVVAVKGDHPELNPFLGHLLAQDYPSFRMVFGVETADDSAVSAIKARAAATPDRVAFAVAGLARDEGQKVANLRAALGEVRATDDVVVFADSDIRPDRDWLTRLVAPLVRGEAEIVSGFAWLVAKDRTFSTQVMCSMAATMVTVPRLPLLNACWGGSTALKRELCETLKLRDEWRGALSDDLVLTALAQRAGCRIAAPREILPRLYVATRGFDEVAADALRWLMCFRVCTPATYAVVLAGLSFAAAGWIAAAGAALLGQWMTLAAALALAVIRSAGRGAIVAMIWGRGGLAENRRFLMADPLTTPLAAILNAVYVWRALFMRRTEWAGVIYEIGGPTRTKVLSRAGTV